MQIEIDMKEVDAETVTAVVLVVTEAILASDVNPTVEEMLVALGELFQAVVEEGGYTGGTVH